MAGCRAVEEVLKRDAARYDIVMFGAEPRPNYNRIMLSPVLAGEKQFEDIIINGPEWYQDNGIVLHSGCRRNQHRHRHAHRLRRGRRRRTAMTGCCSPPARIRFVLPLPGNKLQGVVAFRDIDDVDRMVSISGRGGRAVVIGGGLLGLEAALRTCPTRGWTPPSSISCRRADGAAARSIGRPSARRGT